MLKQLVTTLFISYTLIAGLSSPVIASEKKSNIAKIEKRLDQNEVVSKKVENLFDEKLKFYVTDRYIQEQLAKLQMKFVQIENSIGGDNVTTAKQLMSSIVEIQSRLNTMESRFIRFKEDAEALTHRSIRELARAFGFPDKMKLLENSNAGFSALGNAVHVEVAKLVAKNLLNYGKNFKNNVSNLQKINESLDILSA